ncbi:MAG TPA: thioredoxin family protein [Fulvivirga sp.]|nr:thioredoxin family protein [Fulvivirga sp.]
MKLVMLLLMGLTLSTLETPTPWLTDYDVALVKAKEEDKPILLSFTGSDWCKPCIMLTREVFEDQAFQDYALKNLVLLQADFPRLKKNKLSAEQTEQNESLAAKFNKTGEFPLVVLLNAKGEVIAKTGYQKGGAEHFINYLKGVL